MIHKDATSGLIPKFVGIQKRHSIIELPVVHRFRSSCPKFASAFAARCTRTWGSGTRRCRGRLSLAAICSSPKRTGENRWRGKMRMLHWVMGLALLFAGAAAHGAEAVRIRASWIVAPSDWTPLLPEKPDLMKNNGKTY